VTRAIQIGGLLLLAAASGLSQQKGSSKPPKAAPPPPPPRVGAARPNAQFKNGGPPKAGVRPAPGGPRLPNPLANPVQRL